MILNVIIYFFLIFGIIEFVYLIWELISLKNLVKSEIFVVIPSKKAEEFVYEISNFLRYFPNKAYILSNDGKSEKLLRNIPYSKTVTADQLIEIIRRNYGDDNGNS